MGTFAVESVTQEIAIEYLKYYDNKMATVRRLRERCFYAVGSDIYTDRLLLNDYLDLQSVNALRLTHSESGDPSPWLTVERIQNSSRQILREMEKLYGDVLGVIGTENLKALAKYKREIAPSAGDIEDCPTPKELDTHYDNYKNLIRRIRRMPRLTPNEDILKDFYWCKDTNDKGYLLKHHLALEEALILKDGLAQAFDAKNRHDENLAEALKKSQLENKQKSTNTRRWIIGTLIALVALAISFYTALGS